MAAAAPYGGWKSPISAEMVARGAIVPGEVKVDGDAVWWLELRSAEGGRQAVCCWKPGGGVSTVTPEEFHARTRVHEYGGGAYLAHGGTVWFASFSDQRLYRQDPGRAPRPVSPVPEAPAGLRYADMCITPNGAWLVCVRERHESRAGGKVTNELVAFAAGGDGMPEPCVLATGRDFYAAPRLHPDGRRLAWLSWDHPNMPWDGTELWVADLDVEGTGPEAPVALGTPRRMAGGAEESVFQPEWGPGGDLHFVSDRSGWWNLYRLDPGGQPEAEPLAPMATEFALPQWWLGLSTYAFLADGRVACAYGRGPVSQLGILIPGAGRVDPLPLALPLTSFGWLRTLGNRIACVAGGPGHPPAVALIDSATGEVEILSQNHRLGFDPAFISMPRPIQFPTGPDHRQTAHALYYPPANPGHEGPPGDRPPLLVMAHGGPTGQASSLFRPDIQFFTSRGFAVADVDYRGSSGYGRSYRQRLYGCCGIAEVADCVNAARHLAAAGAVDSRRLAIRGGSAGGYITLCALVFYDDFAAGASYFGIADVETLAANMHKFESRYVHRLFGSHPDQAKLYRERSPIHFIDRLSCPVILLQGLEDAIVPPAQAEAMAAALDAKGIPYVYLGFEGEQHGFRRAENIRRALEAELFFYGRVFGISLADPIEPIEVHNLTSSEGNYPGRRRA